MGGFLVQPEAKYWFCIPFYKHFMGLHAHYGQYNGGFSKYRYQETCTVSVYLMVTNGYGKDDGTLKYLRE